MRNLYKTVQISGISYSTSIKTDVFRKHTPSPLILTVLNIRYNMSLYRFCKYSVLVGTTTVAGALLFQQRRPTPDWQQAARREFSRPSYNPAPPGYRGPLFQPRLDFPSTQPARDETFPWLDMDFKTEPERYVNFCRHFHVRT